jgi:Leucine-rich repeat (LRR) protein
LAGSSVLNITELPKLTNLTYLNLSSTKITMNLTVLKQMTRLSELNLADIPPSRILPEILASLTNLVSLNIAGNSQLVSNAVGILTQIGNLEYLNIEGATSVDGDVIPYLDRFLRLKHLRRNGTKLPSSVEVRYFVKNGLMRNK